MKTGNMVLVLICLALAAGCSGTMPRAILHPVPVGVSHLHVDLYNPEKACNGTTLLADNHDPGRPKIIEVDMHGKVVWEYPVPSRLARYTNPGFDVEGLPSGNILFVLPLHGIYEIDRQGQVVWSFLTGRVSHDADRLPDGNTLFVFGGSDTKEDPQVQEVDSRGRVVWSWRAKDHFTGEEYRTISNQGWTHANAVTRLTGGHTLISLRNFNLIAEVDSDGSLVRTIGRGILLHPHDPEVQPDGTLLVMNHDRPNRALVVDPQSDRVLWQSRAFGQRMSPVRDADRLPNGNLLITGSTRLLEFTPQGELVWRLLLDVTFSSRKQAPARGFYKAQRW